MRSTDGEDSIDDPVTENLFRNVSVGTLRTRGRWYITPV